MLNSIAKNVLASLLTQIVNIAINVLLPPLIINNYGSSINGLIVTILQLMSYVSLVGAGISAAAMQSLYKPIALKDHSKINAILNAANSMFNKAGIIFSSVTVIIAFTYPFLIQQGDLDYWIVFKLVLIISILGASEFFYVGKIRALLLADQKGYIVSYVQAAGLSVGFIFSYILISHHSQIVYVQLASSFIYSFRLVVLYIIVKKRYNYLDKHVKGIVELKVQRNNAFIHQLTGILTLGSQTVILTSFIGLKVSSIYAVHNIVFSGLQSVFGQIIAAIAPFLGRSLNTKSKEVSSQEYNRLEYLFFSLLTIIFPFVTILLPVFIQLYTRNADINYSDKTLAVYFSIFGLLNLLRMPAQMAINSVGHFRETRNRALVEAGLCVLLQLVLVGKYHIYGVLLGSILALGWRCFDIIFYTNRIVLNQSNRLSIIRLLKITSIIIILASINQFFQFTDAISTYFDLLKYCFVFMGISLFLLIVIDLLIERRQISSIIQLIKK